MIQPYGSNVLLERLPASTRFGSFKSETSAEVSGDVLIPAAAHVEGLMIVLPTEVLSHDSFECQVLSVGPGEILPNGKREPMNISPGDLVLVFQGVGTTLDGQQFITDISAVEAVIEK